MSELNNINILKPSEITKEDKEKFKALNEVLKGFNDEQKKAIISNTKNILCVAGAGSGKTTVLTKRIEFLIKYKGINPKKILAITFTRKARQEMIKRLARMNIQTNVETFNSFCEKILKKYGKIIYNKPTKVMNYKDKIIAINQALQNQNLDMKQAVENYFRRYQKNKKTFEQLSNIFINDCFFVLGYFKSKNKELYDFSKQADIEHFENAKMIYNICKELKKQKELQGLRDYTDQILDPLNYFKKHPNSAPDFDHILVDEFQDVNQSQVELLDILSPKNLFCVGDPRQSIFGWRGSDIRYILNFPKKYPGSEIIFLNKNYRSNKHIVDLINSAIKHMNLSDLQHTLEGEKQTNFLNFESEEKEFEYVTEEILNSEEEKHEIFVLARTNRQLNQLSDKLKQKQINHIVRSDEQKTSIKKGYITLATIHAIKGLEAKKVLVIGCNNKNFPCRASDHPVIDLIKPDEYDKEAEEKRLFYVALSRAKNNLILTYTGKNYTDFINEKMKTIIQGEKQKIIKFPKKETKEKSKYKEDWDDMILE